MSECTPPPLRPMTEQEEAQLLAEYGVEGPYDKLLDVQAQSRFLGDYGDRDFFLTGVSDGDEDSDAKDKDADANAVLDRMTREDLLNLNMEAAVIKYTSALGALTSNTFTTNVAAAIDATLSKNSDGRSHASAAATAPIPGGQDAAGKKYLDILRAGKRQEEVAFMLCNGSVGTGTVQQKLAQKAINDLSVPTKKEGTQEEAEDEVVGAADHLLQQASTYFATVETMRSAAKSAKDNPSPAELFDDALSDLDSDDDDDKDDDEVLQRARQLVQRFGNMQAHQLSKEEERREVEADDEAGGKRSQSGGVETASATELSPSWENELPFILRDTKTVVPIQLPTLTATESRAPLLFPLYSYEVEPTRDIKETDEKWRALIKQREAAQEEATSSALIRPAAPPNNELKEGETMPGSPPSASPTPTSEVAAAAHERSVSPPLLHNQRQQDILALIQTMEERDRKLEAQAKAQLKAVYQNNHRRVSEAQRQKERDEKGMVSLQTFGTKVQALLPTKEVPPAAPPRKVSRSGVAVGFQDPSGTTVIPIVTASVSAPETAQSVKMIQQKAALESFLIQREAMERKQMREEDRRVHAHLDHLARQREEIAERIVNCLKDCDASYMALIGAELEAYQDLCDAESRGRTLAKQAVQLREVQATAQLASNVFVEHSLVARNIQQLESSEFADLMKREAQDHSALLQEEARRREAQIQAEKDQHAQAVRSFETQKKALFCQVGSVTKSTTASEMAVAGGSASPVVNGLELTLLQHGMLARERNDYFAWFGQTQKVYQATLADLNEALQQAKARANNTTQPDTVVGSPTNSRPGTSAAATSHGPASPASTLHAGDNNAQSGCSPSLLNAARFRALQSAVLHAAQEDVARAAQYLHSVTFALENIQAIDFSDLTKLSIAVSGLRNVAGTNQRLSTNGPSDACHWLGERFISVCDLVQELDLGSNRLREFALADVLLCFAALRRLSVSDNKLASILLFQQSQQSPSQSQQQRDDATTTTTKRRAGSALRSIAAAQEHALSSRSSITHLNISSNMLPDVESVGRLLFSSLVELQAQANQIASLLPLLTCTLLQKLHVHRNKLQNVEGVSELHLLQELNVSNNYIQSLDALSGHNLLLNKLYASENQMISLFPSASQPTGAMGGPTLSRCLPFLTELYIGHNALKELREETFVWMPFLVLLNAESNELTRISGLALCTRLVTVKLGHNALADISALYPLLTCTRLLSLDVSHNPLMDGGEHAGMESLLQMLPCLHELNNNPVSCAAPTHVAATDTPTTFAKANLRADGTAKWVVAYMGSFSRAYQLLWSSAVWDQYCDTQRTALESQQTFSRRKFYIAEGVEEQVREKKVASGEMFYPSLYNVSGDIEERGRRDHLLLLRKHLNSMPTDRNAFAYEHANVHVKSSGYYYRALLEREKRARKTICEWIAGLVLMRRAKALRRALDAERKQSEAYRREMAVRKIQPLWRGAALRSRLHRLLHPGGEDDDDQYEKVELHFDEFQDDTDHIGALLTKAMNVAAATQLSNFDVPVAFPTTAAAPSVSATKNSPQSFHVTAGDLGARPDSAPFPIKKAGKKLAPLNSEADRPASSAQSFHNTAASVEEQWGADVYSQLQRKKKKMNGVRNQHIMQEFQKDPLNAKRLRESKK